MFLKKYLTHSLAAMGVCLMAHFLIVFGQGTKPPSEQAEDVVRVNSELVQTDVMVFDQRGGFVDGLRQQDFDLHVDGKPRAISFFDRVVAGSRNEDAQLAWHTPPKSLWSACPRVSTCCSLSYRTRVEK